MKTIALNVGAAILVILAAGCLLETNLTDRLPTSNAAGLVHAPKLSVGTPLLVRLSDFVSSETTRRGDSWRGITLRDVASADGAIVPRGSAVSGIVSEVRSAHGARAQLGLRVITIAAAGRSAPVRASVVTESASGTALVFREGTPLTFRVQ